ncbi:hypothetical protein [Streptomyces sp. SID5910]|uniref:hypothetical protein n=1 Tax=Streptomyces sp. SID5910 TaxID=2690312 RepID=UPI001372028F|nr:hypothetical protein [Streptomyces sp. SID5910]MYR43115.1 hypothetical protein [Streptomyces sp. SID5910]
MIIITGPQDTDEAVGLLAEMAGLLDAVPAYSAALQWATATALYCMAGWEHCSLAVADVTIAEACGLIVHRLTV